MLGVEFSTYHMLDCILLLTIFAVGAEVILNWGNTHVLQANIFLGSELCFNYSLII